MFYQSPTILVPADISLQDGIQKMNECRVGSLLVIKSSSNEELVGIFTERDLIIKLTHLKHPSTWKKPISEFMTKGVITLDVFEMEKAGAVMAENHIRHLPVTYRLREGKTIVIGILSLRDIYRKKIWEMRKAFTTLAKAERLQTGIKMEQGFTQFFGWVGDENAFWNLTTQALSKFPQIKSEKLHYISDMDFSQYSLLLADLDETKQSFWGGFLTQFIHSPPGGKGGRFPFLIVLYDPVTISVILLKLVYQLQDASKYQVFKKPVDPLGFLHHLQGLLGVQEEYKKPPDRVFAKICSSTSGSDILG